MVRPRWICLDSTGGRWWPLQPGLSRVVLNSMDFKESGIELNPTSFNQAPASIRHFNLRLQPDTSIQHFDLTHPSDTSI